MSIHRIMKKSVEMPSGETVDIKYWCDSSTVYVAGFDQNSNQVTKAVYQAVVDEIADGFACALGQSLIDGLVATAESDLLNNPQLHYQALKV